MAGPAGRLDAVLVCGGQWHDFDYARLQLLDELAQWEQVRTRVFENYAALDALERADLLVTYTNNVRPVATQQDALVNFVERGGRWLALHGTNSAPLTRPMRRLPSTGRLEPSVASRLSSAASSWPTPRSRRIPSRSPRPIIRSWPGSNHSRRVTSCTSPNCTRRWKYCCTRGSPASRVVSPKARLTDDEPRPVLYLRPIGAGTRLLLHPWTLPRPLRRAGPRPGGSRPARLRQLGDRFTASTRTGGSRS